jgi:hypothetical protein
MIDETLTISELSDDELYFFAATGFDEAKTKFMNDLSSKIQKHQDHDQSSHGNWASSGAGTPINLNPNDWVDYGFPDDFYNKLTDDEILAVSDYQQTGFMRINRWLRDSNPNPNKITPTMKAIDSAIEKAPLVLPDNSAVFRAVDINFIEGLEEGSIITDKGYTSTTMRDLSKMKYSEYKKYEDIGRTIVRIDLGKNKKGLAVNTIHKKTQVILVHINTSSFNAFDNFWPHILMVCFILRN